MKYLMNCGFSSELVMSLERCLPKGALLDLEREKDIVFKNIVFLKNLGIDNYVEAFFKFYNMFLLDCETFQNIFLKYDAEDLVGKMKKNIAIMEYL